MLPNGNITIINYVGSLPCRSVGQGDGEIISITKNASSNGYSPFGGGLVSLKKVPDKTCSDEIMGKGLAIIPSSRGRRPSGLRKTTMGTNSLAHRT